MAEKHDFEKKKKFRVQIQIKNESRKDSNSQQKITD